MKWNITHRQGRLLCTFPPHRTLECSSLCPSCRSYAVCLKQRKVATANKRGERTLLFITPWFQQHSDQRCEIKKLITLKAIAKRKASPNCKLVTTYLCFCTPTPPCALGHPRPHCCQSNPKTNPRPALSWPLRANAALQCCFEHQKKKLHVLIFNFYM